MAETNTNTGVTTNASMGFKNPYTSMVMSIIKIAAVIIIVVAVYIIYRKIKKGLETDSRDELKQIDYIQPNWYLKYYEDYKKNPKKYSKNDIEIFLKNYEYSYDFFAAIRKDLEEEQHLVFQSIFNPYQAIKTCLGIFSTSGIRQVYGAYMLGAMKNIKSQIMLSMMANRFKTETDMNLLDTLNTFYDYDTMTEFFNYIKKLPLTVK